MARYEALDGVIGEKIRKNITTEDDFSSFILQEKERCPFLNSDNLCEMIMESGEEMLCDICKEHPRFYQWYGDCEMQGIGLCCEESCRLLLEQKDPIAFSIEEIAHEVENKKVPEEEDSTQLAYVLLGLQEMLFGIIKNQELPFAQRMEEVLRTVSVAEAQLFGAEIEKNNRKLQGIDSSLETSREILEVMGEMEAINQEWTETLERLAGNLEDLLDREEDYRNSQETGAWEQENIFMYILYRHFMKTLDFGGMTARVKFAMIGLWFIHLSNLEVWVNSGERTNVDKINAIKRWSQQVEYSEENVDTMIEACDMNGKLSIQCIIQLF